MKYTPIPMIDNVVSTEGLAGRALHQLSEHVYLFEDTCNVYAIRHGREAVLIDFGEGAILPLLSQLGVTQVTDVLMTHHHRDQGQGLGRAIEAGARIWVPHTEAELFQDVSSHWQARELYANYNMRQDRFSLLEPVLVAGTLRDYATYHFGGQPFTIVPTPGHTTGSITILAEVDGRRFAFTGDLIAAPGKVWSLAATQWSYNGAEGVAASIPSLLDLKERRPDVLLPSHGRPIADPPSAIDLLVERLRQLLVHRHENPRLFRFMDKPYEPITRHLLRNLTSMANSYVLLSDSGKALLIDYGYDFVTGIALGSDRASRRPWLYTLNALKRQYGVQQIDVVIPTHYHDDHVAGFNLLRAVEGTQVWAAENFADILARPSRYDLPCLWYEPIPVDRVLPLSCPITWQEYELTLYSLPGHTRYAVAIAFEVDRKRVLATGDQYHGNNGLGWNYVYRNQFQIGDYRASAELYGRLEPDLILSGHWEPLWVTPGYLDAVRGRGEALESLHTELLPPEIAGFGAEGFGASIHPYQVTVTNGEAITFDVDVRNPFLVEETAVVQMVVPPGWQVAENDRHVRLAPHGTQTLQFSVAPPAGFHERRARVAVNLSIGGRPFGQQAEALVTGKPVTS